MNNRILNSVVLVVAFGMIGWFSFQSYLNSNKYKEEIKESDTTVNGTQEETQSGITLNNFNHLSGIYHSEKTDPITSDIVFETFGATAAKGTFKDFEITASFNESDQFELEVSIDVASIYTAESMRDDHLKGEEFFNVEKFSTITFKSNQIVKGDTSYVAKGDITFLGNTKSLDVPFIYKGSASGKENTEVFKGSFNFNPIAYGMESDAGDKVTVSFYTELLKQ